MHWTLGEWEQSSSHELKQMPSHRTELLFPCDREHRFSCRKGSLPPDVCDVLACAALTLSWCRVCFSNLRSHNPAFLWPFVLWKYDYSLVWVCSEDHMVSSGWSHSTHSSCKNIYCPCSPCLEGNSPCQEAEELSSSDLGFLMAFIIKSWCRECTSLKVISSHWCQKGVELPQSSYLGYLKTW